MSFSEVISKEEVGLRQERRTVLDVWIGACESSHWRYSTGYTGLGLRAKSINSEVMSILEVITQEMFSAFLTR